MGKKIIKLTESDLENIVKRVLNENPLSATPRWEMEMRRDVSRVASGIGDQIAKQFDLMENYREIGQMIEQRIIDEFGTALEKYYSSFEY